MTQISAPARLLAILAGAALLAVACSSREVVTGCEGRPGAEPVCGFQNPEDLALLPDGHTVVVSQFGAMDGGRAGNLALFDSSTQQLAVAFRGGDDVAAPVPGWGDASCPGPPGPAFSPHGIDLARRDDGRLQLLVVNHGGREAVELFDVEVGGEGAEASLRWRGCAVPPEGAYLNDLVHTPEGGFLVTHMMDKESQLLEMIRGGLGWDTGYVLEWRPGQGYRPVPGTEAPFPNGIELSADGESLYLNAYLGGEVRRIDRRSGALRARAAIPSPDNLSWASDGRLLVASHRGGLRDQMQCQQIAEGACPMEFAIHALDADSLAGEVLFANAGPPMGAGTVAIEVGRELLIGSFAGDRILRVPR